jgi:putative phosphoesterase
MKLLILSDVHGNLTALEAVLRAEPSFDRVLFLGDAVDYGPDPAACLDRLTDLEPVWVKGNHDNAVATGADCACAAAFRRLSRASREFTRSVLRPEQLDLLRTLPVERTVSVGGQDFYLTHASPADHLFEYVSPTADPQRWARAMEAAPEPCRVILVGHTHRPYLRPFKDKTAVNPGSVGQPRDHDPRASYAIWEDGHISLKRVSYDVASTVRRLEQTGQPDEVVRALAAVLLRGGLP